jgi:hypothetical protein
MNFKTIPATREVIESPIEARVSVDQHYIICSHVLSYIIYTIRTLLHMFPVHKMKGLQHLRYPVLQAPLYLPFLVVTVTNMTLLQHFPSVSGKCTLFKAKSDEGVCKRTEWWVDGSL